MGAADIFGIEEPYTRYDVTLRVRDLLVGGVPANATTIRNWLRSRMEVQDQALEELVQETLRERFKDETPGVDEIITALMEDPDSGLSVNGFKRNDDGELCYETRCMKAGLKEAINSAYPGVDWDGKASAPGVAKRKGLMSTAVERVFVEGTLIPLGVKASEVNPECIGVGCKAHREERIKHVITPQGPKSAINTVEVVHAPELSFVVRVHDDFLSREAWGRVWSRAEDIGIGADRGRSDGQFDLLKWAPVPRPKQAKK